MASQPQKQKTQQLVERKALNKHVLLFHLLK